MRESYDFSQADRNPYANRLKKQITIRLDVEALEYFHALSRQLGIPYQTLINLYLRDCASSKLRPPLSWAAEAGLPSGADAAEPDAARGREPSLRSGSRR